MVVHPRVLGLLDTSWTQIESRSGSWRVGAAFFVVALIPRRRQSRWSHNAEQRAELPVERCPRLRDFGLQSTVRLDPLAAVSNCLILDIEVHLLKHPAH